MIVVHPKDPSTEMLGSIYEDLPNVRLFDSYLQRDEILSAIAAAPIDEPILLLGHGSPRGLFDIRYGLVINSDDSCLLENRPNLICIWCYASSYAYLHSLKGFFSGMFISEPREALMCGVGASDEEIGWCASDFALRLGDLLRAGKTVAEAASEMMDPKWIVSDLTEYNYSRLEYRPTGGEDMPMDDRRFFEESGIMSEEEDTDR